MPAVGLPGASFPIHPLYFPRGQSTVDQRMNFGLLGASASQLPFAFPSNWLLGSGGVDKSRSPSSSSWHSLATQTSGFLFANNFQMFPKGWRNGDWICNCGFHNYANRTQVFICCTTSILFYFYQLSIFFNVYTSSIICFIFYLQCKKCDASAPPGMFYSYQLPSFC